MKSSTGAKIGKALIFTVITVWVLAPLYIIVSTAFKQPAEFVKNPLGLPSTLYFGNFVDALKKANMFQYALNSILTIGAALVLIVILNTLCSYGISKLYDKWIGKVFYAVIVSGMMLASVGYVTMILLYQRVGLYNSLWALVVAFVAASIPMSVFLLTGFIRGIPKDVLEAAEMDGCTDFQCLWRVVMPLMVPAISTVVVFNLVTCWNNMLTPLLLLKNPDLYTIPVGLLAFRGTYNTQYTLMFAAMLLSAIPIIIIYFAFQDKFVESLAGSVKG